MENILVALSLFFIVATIIKISVDNIGTILKPFADIQKYKLVVAFILTTLAVWSFNFGILEALELSTENSKDWFHLFDLGITSIFLTGGSQAIHKLADAWNTYRKSGETDGK